jgi:hypothetical protein
MQRHDVLPAPSPLGTLQAWALPLWQAECSTPLASERVCGRLPPDRCDKNFHSIWPAKANVIEDLPGASATLKLTCASEGWGVWTDDLHRIVGLCVAYQAGSDESVRLTDFVWRHSAEQDAKRVSDFIRSDKRDASTDGWRWFEAWDMVPKPASMGEQACFEVRLPR